MNEAADAVRSMHQTGRKWLVRINSLPAELLKLVLDDRDTALRCFQDTAIVAVWKGDGVRATEMEGCHPSQYYTTRRRVSGNYSTGASPYRPMLKTSSSS